MKLTRRQFEALVERAVARLPRRFREKLENIAVVVRAVLRFAAGTAAA